jgi:hypothetical protein
MEPARTFAFFAHGRDEPTMKQSLGRKIAAACIIAAGACFICSVYLIGLTNENATERDYIEYWAAGQLLVHHGNPYDLAAILNIEKTAGLKGNDPKANVGPPIALVLLAPLAFVSPKIGLIVWLAWEFACLSIAIRILWILLDKPPSGFLMLGFVFPPVLACLQAGQLGVYMLAGVVLFLFLCDTSPVLAGAALMPCALKPHLFLPFAFALLLWAISKRRFGAIAGFLGSLSITTLLTLLIDRNVWLEYSALMHSTRLMQIRLPTLSANLRFLVAPNAVWLQYVPMLAATGWASWFFLSRRQRWNWLVHGQLVLLVSLLCSPYGWLTDEAVLLPSVLLGVYRAIETRRSLVPIALFSTAALIEVFANFRITSWYYIWTTPAWLAWYLYATREIKNVALPHNQNPAIATP